MLLLPTFCPTPPTICGLCGHGKTATTPRILLSTGGVQGYDLGPTLWNYYGLGWGIVIDYDPDTGIYTIPPWNPAAIGAPPIPPIPPIPVYDSRNQIIATISGSQNLSPTGPLNDSLTYFGGAPTTIPPGPPPYTNIQGPGDWVGSVGQDMSGWIDPQQISIPDDWWAWTTGKISDQVLHVTGKRVYINRDNDIGVGFGGSWSYSPQWDYGGTWISAGTWYFYPDDLNVPGHT